MEKWRASGSVSVAGKRQMIKIALALILFPVLVIAQPAIPTQGSMDIQDVDWVNVHDVPVSVGAGPIDAGTIRETLADGTVVITNPGTFKDCTPQNVTCNGTPGTILSANPMALRTTAANIGTAAIYLGYGSTGCSTISATIGDPLYQRQMIFLDGPNYFTAALCCVTPDGSSQTLLINQCQ